MTGLTTCSALCSLIVSTDVWEKDVVLQLVCKLASPFQLSINQEKKGSKIELVYSNGTCFLNTRNAILRALCGFGLYYALDERPYYLMGGHSITAQASNLSAVAMGTLQSMQSLASTLDPLNSAALASLDAMLETNAFLVPAFQPTIADMDVAWTLRNADVSVYPNLLRWRNCVLLTMHEYGKAVGMAITAPEAQPNVIPTFFYGLENVEALLKPQQVAKQPLEQQKQGEKQKEKKKEEQPKKKEVQQTQQENQAPADFDISALDIRVGKITKAWHHEEADKLFCEEIDLGTETRQIASGLRPFYKTEDVQDRLVLVLCNLKKRNLVGFPSHGMVLCASNADHTSVEFVVPPPEAKIGERVVFEGYKGEPEPDTKIAKKKIFEKLAPDLQTNASGQVNWKGALATTSAGVVKALNGMPNAHVA